MSRQISFFHAERDLIQFVREIEKNNGMIVIGDSAILPTYVENIVLSKMSTYSCKFSIIPAKLVDAYNKRIHNSMTLEFNNCCKGNSLSRTYEVGRLYLAPTCGGNYVPETLALYESLRKYIRTVYHFEKKVGAYFAPEFWEKYHAHYYFATCAGKPVLV